MALNICKIKLSRFALPVLFLLFMFNQADGPQGIAEGRVPKSFVIPEWVSVFSQYITLVLLGAVCLYSLFNLKVLVRQFYRPLLLFVAAFFLLFAHSLMFGEDVLRYAALLLMAFFFVAGIYRFISHADECDIYYYMTFVLWVFLAVSAFYSFANIATHPRVSGFLVNPNTFGFALIGCVTLYSIIKKGASAGLYLFWICCLFFVISTGSRLALAGFIISAPFALQFNFQSRGLIVCFMLLGAVGLCLVVVNAQELSNIRAFQFSNAIGDSGRSSIWLKALEVIQANPFVGGGGNVKDTVGAGNVHNAYLRILAMVGIPLGGIFILLFFIGTVKLLFSNGVHKAIKGFYIAVPVLFIGEDYIVAIVGVFAFFFWVLLAIAWKMHIDYCAGMMSNG